MRACFRSQRRRRRSRRRGSSAGCAAPSATTTSCSKRSARAGSAARTARAHRDLTPENMLIDPDGRLRITDFGLALALRGDARWGGATSRSGTPLFAAPEQLLGERVDQRADLYSLAATAYFALLGRPPFEGPTAEAILARQTTEDPPSLHDARHDVPRELEDVLRKALASEPAARYPTATAFRDALRRSRGLLFRLRALLSGKGCRGGGP